MAFSDKKGITVASPFKLQAESMLDVRQQVDTIEERNELVTIKAATAGLRVYVKATKKSYVYNGTSWDTLSVGDASLIVKLNGGTSEGTNQFTYNGTAAKSINITPSAIGAAPSSHTHTKAQITDFPTSMKNPQALKFAGAVSGTYDGSAAVTITIPSTANTAKSLIVKLNNGDQEGTDLFTFNGSTEKTINITPGVIGAAPTSHTHNISNITGLTAGRAVISDSNGHPAVSAVTSTELSYLDGVTSNIQTQLNNKANATHTHNYAGSSSAGGAANSVKSSLIVKLNGGTEEGTSQFTFNGSAAKTVNITAAGIGAATSSHTHTKAQITDFPTTMKNPKAITFTGGATGTYDGSSAVSINIPTSSATPSSLTIQLNGGSAEGTNKFTFNGSSAKSINITPANIGAAASSHTHSYAGSSSAGGAANSAVKLNTARNINGVAFDGTKDISVPNNYFAQVSNGVDLNTLRTYGEYYAAGGTGAENAPSGVDYFYLRIFRNASGYTGQLLYANGAWYSRFYNGEDWSAWSELYSSTNKPTASEIGAAASNHTHNYAGSSSAGGAANSVKSSLIVKLNGGTSEGTNQFTFNGSAAKTVNITASSIGAAARSHTHTKAQITDFPTTMKNPQAIKFTGAATGTYDGSTALTINIPTSGATDESLIIKLNGGTSEGTNQFTFNGGAAKTVNITPSAIGAAAASHGTHVTYGSGAPKAAGTASAGSASSVSRSDHVHPAQTTVSGNAGSATKLATSRTIDGVSFNGTGNITHYGTCATAAGTAAKVVSLTGFTLATGAKVTVKFTVTNTAANPTLNVNNTGAKAIQYRGSAISAGYLAANRVYTFIYDGTNYQLIGDINTDTNTTYNTGTSTIAGITKLYTGTGSNTDGTMTQDAITDALNGKAASSHSHSVASTSAAGFLRQLSGSTSQFMRGDGTWATPPNTTYSTFKAATSSAAGGAGLVPAPAKGYQSRFLRGDATWQAISLSTFGVTATAAELNYMDGVTSNVQTQLNGKANSSHTHNYAGSSSAGGAATSAAKVNSSLVIKLNGGTTEGTNQFTFNGSAAKSVNITASSIGAAASSHTHGATSITGLTANRALISNGSGQVAVSSVTSTELGYLDGVTSNIQTQLNGKAASNHNHNYAGSSSAGGAANSANRVPVPVGTVLFSTSSSTTFFNSCFGGTWEVVGNIDAIVGTSSTLTLYMFRKTAA